MSDTDKRMYCARCEANHTILTHDAALRAALDRETELRRAAERHNAELRKALNQHPYPDEYDREKARADAAEAEVERWKAEFEVARSDARDAGAIQREAQAALAAKTEECERLTRVRLASVTVGHYADRVSECDNTRKCDLCVARSERDALARIVEELGHDENCGVEMDPEKTGCWRYVNGKDNTTCNCIQAKARDATKGTP